MTGLSTPQKWRSGPQNEYKQTFLVYTTGKPKIDGLPGTLLPPTKNTKSLFS